MADSSIISSNLDAILRVKKGSSLVADENGRLKIDSPKSTLFSFFLSDRYLYSNEGGRNQIINETCQQVFDQIVSKYRAPLTSDLLPREEKEKVEKLVKSVSKIGQRILNSQLKEDLNELVNSPETLEARLALRQGINPQVLNQTISGTYIMRNRQGKPWGIFKPQRQEVGGDKNPHWDVWANYKAEQWDIESGTGYLRECAAYQLDKGHFAEVPLTVPTHFQHPALDTSLIPLITPDLVGSFQLYKKDCSAGLHSLKFYEFHSIDLRKTLPQAVARLIHKIITLVFRFLFYCGLRHVAVDQIHKMAIMDIRLLNCDRHLGNFLVDNSSRTIYPIDHGLILPNVARKLRFDWNVLIQSRFPFSKATLDYIKGLDPDLDEKILRKCGITSVNAIERMKLSTKLLQIAADRGLNLNQIADLMLQRYPTSSGLYFEDVICKKVLKEGKDPKSVINEAIDLYLFLF